MNKDNSLFVSEMVLLYITKSIINRLLTRFTTSNDTQYFFIVSLCQKPFQILKPCLNTNNYYAINTGSIFKLVNNMTDYCFSSELKKLFWLISATHTRSNAASKNNCKRITS